ncbi:MAG: TGS domain-containing protein [Porphyromonadaceae bacterium]|nr:TGS domain-containing protein [Porphyromonadaceae bacterium]
MKSLNFTESAMEENAKQDIVREQFFSPLESGDRTRIYGLMRSLLGMLDGYLDIAQRRTLYLWIRDAYLASGFAAHHSAGEAVELITTLEAARIAMRELHLDAHSVIAMLLFRPVAHGCLAQKDVARHLGNETERLLYLLMRTSALYLRKESISSHNFHNLLLSMAEDIRVVLLIISDRLYRLRHAKHLYRTVEERTALAVEISFLYAPIAHRLGLYTIKGEMEDLCLKWRDRNTFDFIKSKLGETKTSRDAYIARFLAPLRTELDAQLDVPYEMKGRVKSISSIHNKLRKQSFEDIYDLFAIRIIFDVPEHRERQVCWQVYSIVTDLYQPNPERLKDWISIPKSNGYESLHITVIGPDNKWVEVQIRTKRMDAIAEQGVAAHWRYKGIKSEGEGLESFLASVRETLEAVQEEEGRDRSKILESSMMTLKAQEIYVFTPMGEVLKLPRGATVLDFAFAIHSKVGASAVSAKVNGKNVSIKHQLQNGDAVEVVTSSQQTPKQDWLSIVVSQRAKNRIRQLLRLEEEAGIVVAKEMLQRRMRNRKLVYQESLFVRLAARRGYKGLSDFFKDMTLGRLDLKTFLDLYEVEYKAWEQSRRETLQSVIPVGTQLFTPSSVVLEMDGVGVSKADDVLLIDQGISGVVYTFAQCCMPVYGDEVFGFVGSRGIKIHRTDCPNAPDMIARTGHRVLSARWTGEGEHYSTYSIEVVGRDDIAVVTHIISLIKKDNGMKLRGYSLDSSDGLFRATFTLNVASKDGIGPLIKKIRSAVGVKKVERL